MLPIHSVRLSCMNDSNLPKIGIVSGGGDCPGINTVIYSVVKAAKGTFEVIGIHGGFEGMLERNLSVLKPEDVFRFQGMGGTILGTASKGKYSAKRGMGDNPSLPEQLIDETCQAYQDIGFEALISIGGDGTMTISNILQDSGINIVGVPKTIDNDLSATDKTFGFDSAIEYVTDAIDRIKTTAESHHRIFIIEVMGRHAGWIALHSSISGASHMALIPEIPFTYDHILRHLKDRYHQNKKFSIIVIAEGAHGQDETECIARIRPDGEALLGGAADRLLCFLESSFPEQEVRSVVLGHLQRGGKPSATDRVLASVAGVKAVEMVKDKEYGRMIAFRDTQVESLPIKDAIAQLKLVNPSSEMVKTARSIGIHFGDET